MKKERHSETATVRQRKGRDTETATDRQTYIQTERGTEIER